MRKSGVFSMLSDILNFREAACGSPSENFTPTSEGVASSGCHQHLGFKNRDPMGMCEEFRCM